MKSKMLDAVSYLNDCTSALECAAEEMYYLTHSDVQKMFEDSSLGLMCLYKERIDEMIRELSDLRDDLRERMREGEE